MSETAQDKVNRILRDHEGYTGDGKGGDGALPVGDRSTAVKPIVKRDLREALIAPLQDTWDARDAAQQAQSDAEDARDLAQQAAGSVQYPVSYGVAQSLTGPQQQQARDNIGLGTAATVDHGTDPGEVPLNSDLGSMAVEDAGDYVTKASKATQAQAEGGVTGDVWMDDIRVRQAIAMWAIGVGQTWVNVAGSRSATTVYQNTTGRPIQVAIRGRSSVSNPRDVEVSANGSTWLTIGMFSSSGTTGIMAATDVIIPPLHYYRVNGAGTIHSWLELR